MKIYAVGQELFPVDRQTNGWADMVKANSRFSK